jgi:molybdopterin-containing oxidoreductase family iron-sulfur binding subunit
MPFGGYGKGLLVQSLAGRPIKVEGNPRTPASLGATDPFAQASSWTCTTPTARRRPRGGEVNTWACSSEPRERLDGEKAQSAARACAS